MYLASSSTAMSASEPTESVPISPAGSPIAAAAPLVDAAMTVPRSIPSIKNLVMTVGMSYAGPLSDPACKSVEIESGQNPLSRAAASATGQLNAPWPWPTQNCT